MSTDLYGVRVLRVDAEQLRFGVEVFVVHYDPGARTYPSVPDDLGFFLHLLWEAASDYAGAGRKGPLSEFVDIDTVLDYAWVEANARRFVSGIERVATDNHPPTAAQWRRLQDFSYARAGGWQDEDLLVRFEYDVRVTDRRWLEPLRVGDAWGTTMFPLNADTWTDEDAPHLPDLAHPVRTWAPFDTAAGDLTHDHVTHLEFSDDGKYLAACSDQGRIWVYDTSDWSEVVHTRAEGRWSVPMMMWVPGEHVLTVKDYGTRKDVKVQPQWAIDLNDRAEVEAPFQAGHMRSHDGVYRIVPNGGAEGGYDLHPTEQSPHRRISHAGRWDPIQCTAFSGDGSRLFLGAQQNLYTVDPATGEVVDKVTDASERLFEIASNPDGGYLAIGSFSRKLSYLVPSGERPHELCVWRMADRKIVMGRQLTTWVDALAWSPDGRWLVAAEEPLGKHSFHGVSRIVVFPMGPTDAP
ncbi:WD40 repeat domain-containing protein [Embleya sp. NBC_00888]|uniref:WD40 repeat domain-containing protein n=1 Tax=Embleya sp. NBC_00888 TaxID=2975960 RepID=UPI00386EA9D9|nr:WD40 repeat domain-containing protein [Embleya sp. NBC_00888]